MDLVSTAGLSQACLQLSAERAAMSKDVDWTQHISAQLGAMRNASEYTFRSPDFQRDLWEGEAISATGMGSVPTAELWHDQAVVDALWAVKTLDPALDADARTDFLVDAWDKLIARVRQLDQRIPRLKMARVFAALQPADFTTLASRDALRKLAKAMRVGKPGDHEVWLHRRILERLDAALADTPLPKEHDWQLTRMKLPWVLYSSLEVTPDKGDTVQPGNEPGATRLLPLPAARRRKGLLAIKDYFASLLGMLQFAETGCARTDFREHIRSVNPSLATSSINTQINALIAEWDAVRIDGDQVGLTDRGLALLESGDPDEASDWLLTRILGFDNALYFLKDGAVEQKALMSMIQAVNPGWTTNFAPSSMIGWLRSLGLADVAAGASGQKLLNLTERGKEWLALINWVPESLAAPDVIAAPVVVDDPANAAAPRSLQRPSVAEIAAGFPDGLVFSNTLIAQLDASLWAHPRRHFAVLAGLSGSGKTQLAINYARALWQHETGNAEDGMYVLPVQPGWHDPSAVLGYVNPLKTDTYVRTGLLDFLLNAVRDPDRPYTVILDEMNLSHPEQYLAPLLSAMETGGRIELHADADGGEEIPGRVNYPSNLLLIGTVNMDETTYGLSDKVLDRASVLEFWDINVDAWPRWSQSKLASDQVETVRTVLRELAATLASVRLHFGWRSIRDIVGYVEAAVGGGVIGFADAVDQAVYAKILPKLRGEDSPRLREAFNATRGVLNNHALAKSEAKLQELLQELAATGTARFWR